MCVCECVLALFARRGFSRQHTRSTRVFMIKRNDSMFCRGGVGGGCKIDGSLRACPIQHCGGIGGCRRWNCKNMPVPYTFQHMTCPSDPCSHTLRTPPQSFSIASEPGIQQTWHIVALFAAHRRFVCGRARTASTLASGSRASKVRPTVLTWQARRRSLHHGLLLARRAWRGCTS